MKMTPAGTLIAAADLCPRHIGYLVQFDSPFSSGVDATVRGRLGRINADKESIHVALRGALGATSFTLRHEDEVLLIDSAKE